MISIEKEEQIRRLLSLGKTAISIAKIVGVERQLVGLIRKLSGIRNRKETNLSGEVPVELKESKRCESCGGKVTVWPCLLCNPKGGCY